MITTKPAPDNSPYVIYTVYTDKGQVFHGDSVQGLAATAAKNDDSAQPYDAKVMAAARLAANNAEVRAGVLKLLATMKDVTVGKTDVDGQRALTLTGNAAIQGGGGAQVITVNADNGLPINSEVVPAKDSAEPSKPSMVTYKSSRVTLADVVAGKIWPYFRTGRAEIISALRSFTRRLNFSQADKREVTSDHRRVSKHLGNLT